MFDFGRIRPGLPTEKKETYADGVLTIKNVLYDKTGNEVIVSQSTLKVDEELTKINAQIATLQERKAQLEAYANTTNQAA